MVRSAVFLMLSVCTVLSRGIEGRGLVGGIAGGNERRQAGRPTRFIGLFDGYPEGANSQFSRSN